MKNLKVFISMPMNGKSIEEIKLLMESYRKIVLDCAEGKDYQIEFVDSILTDYDTSTVKNKGVAFLGKSLELLSTADLVVFAPGWFNFNGCWIEHAVAERYGMKLGHIIEGIKGDLVYNGNWID